MIAEYLDLKTGKKAKESGLTIFQLTGGNWSCDCNREANFMEEDSEFNSSGRCDGHKRYIVIGVEYEPGEDEQDIAQEDFCEKDVISEANAEYYFRLNPADFD